MALKCSFIGAGSFSTPRTSPALVVVIVSSGCPRAFVDTDTVAPGSGSEVYASSTTAAMVTSSPSSCSSPPPLPPRFFFTLDDALPRSGRSVSGARAGMRGARPPRDDAAAAAAWAAARSCCVPPLVGPIHGFVPPIASPGPGASRYGGGCSSLSSNEPCMLAAVAAYCMPGRGGPPPPPPPPLSGHRWPGAVFGRCCCFRPPDIFSRERHLGGRILPTLYSQLECPACRRRVAASCDLGSE